MSYYGRLDWTAPSEPQGTLEQGKWTIAPVPPLVRGWKGALNHRTRSIVRETSPYYGWCETWIMWCGQRMFRTSSEPRKILLIDKATVEHVCHRCEDNAVIVGGEPFTDLFPQTGCEASGGAYFVSQRTAEIRMAMATAPIPASDLSAGQDSGL